MNAREGVYGRELTMVHKASDHGHERISTLVTSLQDSGVAFNARGNTVRAMSLELDELVPGLVRRDEGGVVRIVVLQFKDYAYIRP